MKISGDNLAASLSRPLRGIYLVSGDEPLLVNEAADAVRAKARAEGYSERELHVVERGFDWQALLAQRRSLSLFAQRKIIEIRMASPAPGEQGADAIVQLAEQAGPDNTVLIITGKLDGRTQSSRWVCAIDKQGVVVQVGRSSGRACQPGSASAWRATSCRSTRLPQRCWPSAWKATFAAHHEVEKLALLLPPGAVSAETVMEAVADSALRCAATRRCGDARTDDACVACSRGPARRGRRTRARAVGAEQGPAMDREGAAHDA